MMCIVQPQALLLLAVTACGRIDFQPMDDGGGVLDGVDVAPPCTFGAWQAPQTVTSLSSNTDEYGGQVTGDGLAFYFQRSNEVFAAHRASRAAAWPAPVSVSSLNPTGNQTSEVAPARGELEVYLARDEGTGQCTYYASRPSLADAFSVPARLDALCASSVRAVGPNISTDGLTLYYSTMENGALGRILESHRATVTDAFAAGAPSPGFDTATDKGYPFVTRDELTMYWEGGTAAGHHLYESHRASTTDAWGPSVVIAGVEDGSDNEDVSITDDGLELYFSSRRVLPASLGGMDLLVSTRTCD